MATTHPRILQILLILFALTSIPFTGHTAPVGEIPLKTLGRTAVSWSPSQGLKIRLDGVPLVRESTLYLVKKDWSGVYLNQRDADWRINDWVSDNSGGWVATAATENENGAFAYEFKLLKTTKGESFQVDLRYRLKTAFREGVIEYAAGYLSGNVLRGAVLTSTQLTGTGEKIISFAPQPGGSQEKNRLLPPFQNVYLKTRLGEIHINYSGDAPLPVLFDARNDTQEWATKFPVFWMGIGSPAPLITSRDGERHASFSFTFERPEKSPRIASDIVLYSNNLLIRNDAYTPTPAEPLIIPRPKEMDILRAQSPFRLTDRVYISPTDSSIGTRRAIGILQRAIQERYGFTPDVKIGKSPDAGMIIIGVQTKRSGTPVTSVPDKPEGYAVSVSTKNIRLIGKDEAGILWAVQSLIQLLTADTTSPLIPALSIRDWPSLPLRGVHLFHGVNALPFHEKLLDRIFSRFKLNALFIEAEHLKWDTIGSAAPKWGGTKEDIRKEILYARERGVTVYPLVQGFGHMETLFGATGNRSFAEDPENPWAVNFTDPTAVAYLTKLLTEADDLFGAPAFHVGMDEVDLRGRFPYRSLPKTKPELVALAARHWRDVFAKRGKPVYLWADMLMAASEVSPAWGTLKVPAEAQKTRELMPKDVTLIDWQYGVQEKFPSLRFLQNAGFKDVLAATWFQPENIRNLSRAAKEAGAKGILQTTWCGYESKEEVLNGPERRQFTAMILAADYFWNGGEGPSSENLPYDPSLVFARAYQDARPENARSAKGYALAFKTYPNESPTKLAQSDTSNMRPPLPKKIRLSDGLLYEMMLSPLMLAGKLNPPGEYPLALNCHLSNAKVTDIHLLLSATHRADIGTKIGSLIINFTDGSMKDIALLYGKNIAAGDDLASAPDAPILWRTRLNDGQPFLLRGFAPIADPQKTIDSLRITSSQSESAVSIYAITCLQKRNKSF